MSDEEIRALERAYRASGSASAAAAWLKALVRAEALHPQRLSWVASAPQEVFWRQAAREAGGVTLSGEGYRFWDRDLMEASLSPGQRRHFALDCAERVLPLLESAVAPERLREAVARGRRQADGETVEGFPELVAALGEELRAATQASTRDAAQEACMSLRDALRICAEDELGSVAGHRAAAARWSAANPAQAAEAAHYQLAMVSEEETAWQVQRLCAYALNEAREGVPDAPDLATPAPPDGRTLHTAVGYLDFDHLRRLLASGVDVDQRDRSGRTPLQTLMRSAKADERGEALEILCAAGADLEARDENGLTPLHNAASDGQLRFAQILLEGGADPNALRESDATTPLSLGRSKPEIVKLLLGAGADPEFPPEAPQSVLMLAARDGCVPSIRLLLEAGVDPARRCGLSWAEGDTAADLAAKEGTPPAEALLRRAMQGPLERQDEVLSTSLEDELERLRGLGREAEAEVLARAATWPDLSFRETRRHAAGEVARFDHAPTGLVFALVPAGRLALLPSEHAAAAEALLNSIFSFGDDEEEEEEEETEPDPPLPLRVEAPFLLAETVLTSTGWQAAGLATAEAESLAGVVLPGIREAGHPDEPVRGFSFDQAEAVAESLGCRLPSAAEWEFAARAGVASDEKLADVVEQAHFSALAPARVASLLPNGYGLFDMLGNVRQWVADKGPHHEDAEPGQRALYGSQWEGPAPYSASEVYFAARGESDPRAGLRLARSLSPG